MIVKLSDKYTETIVNPNWEDVPRNPIFCEPELVVTLSSAIWYTWSISWWRDSTEQCRKPSERKEIHQNFKIRWSQGETKTLSINFTYVVSNLGGGKKSSASKVERGEVRHFGIKNWFPHKDKFTKIFILESLDQYREIAEVSKDFQEFKNQQ